MTLLRENDTIAAIATPVGPGGIGVVRVSGRLATRFFNTLFHPKKAVKNPESHKLYYGWFIDPETGGVIDEVLAVLMKAPHSYTTEDVLEIQCHSGPAVINRILEIFLSSGARLADPGEFTRRAFLNGRIDLTQAEAVAELASAKSNSAGRLAVSLLQGRLSEKINAVRDVLKDCLASIEVAIDYPEEDVEILDEYDIKSRVETGVITPLKVLISQFDRSRIFRTGVQCLIAGRPNVGKSSLLNALLCEDRAIVTSIPGTTRDPVEAELQIGGILVKFIDTAGIRPDPDPVEAVGIEKAGSMFETADIILWLIDVSVPLGKDDIEAGRLIARYGRFDDTLLVFSKIDVPGDESGLKHLAEQRAAEISEQFPQADTGNPLLLSSRTGAGLSALEQRVSERIMQSSGTEPPEIGISQRHRDVLSKALDASQQGLSALDSGMSPEIAALELRAALSDLSEVTGEGVTEEVLDRLFSSFCLGK